MIHFLPGDQRRRHKFIDRTIDNYSEVLDRSEENSQSYLSESFIADHRTIIESLAVPNLRHGVLSMGKTAVRSEFYLPVYALHRNESVFFDIESSLQHPMQHRETMKFFHDHNLHDADQIDQKMREFNVNNNHQFGPVPDAQAFIDSKILFGKSDDMNTVMIRSTTYFFPHGRHLWK